MDLLGAGSLNRWPTPNGVVVYNSNREEAWAMKRIIELALVALVMSACGYDPPESSNYQGSTNAPMTEEEQARQPSVNQ
jgi:hypothetical protein